MTEVIVSQHAAVRYCERVDRRLTPVEAITAIRKHSRVIIVAIKFGCRTVKLANGARLHLKGNTVITVLGRDQKPFGPERLV
jgi:hypothetical protein